MKKLSLLVILFFSITLYASAQRPENRRNEIETYKVKYLTDKLELSAAEAKIFWPIYKNWQAEQAALRKERGQKMISFRKIEEIEALSDVQVQSLINNELNIKQKALNIDKKYYNQLKSQLPIKIVGKYYRAQETFKKELLNRYRNNRNND
jgi:CO/xanthine dehydrogenase Mo-binding subunit